MHQVDETTEHMVRIVLAHAENRLRMNPVPLDKGALPGAKAVKRVRDAGNAFQVSVGRDRGRPAQRSVAIRGRRASSRTMPGGAAGW